MVSIVLTALLAASSFSPTPTQKLVSPTTGAITLELGTLSDPLHGDLVSAVRTWALSQRTHYGLPVNASLRSGDAFSTKFGASFHLQQTVNDVDVYGARLVVTLDATGRVVQVASSLEPVSKVLDGGLSHDEAMRRAGKTVPFTMLRPDGVPYGGAKRFFMQVGDELHAAWVTNVKTAEGQKNWYVAIDAVTGAQLFAQDRVHHASPLSANVYPISPGGLDAGVGATPTVIGTLTFNDGGTMIGDSCAFPQADGGIEFAPNDGGELCGTKLMSYNCCPSEGCAPDAGPKRYVGNLTFQGFNVSVDLAMCDRLRRASNVTNPSGDFRYTPVDPPVNKTVVDPADPSNSDEFAEVHSFFHVNRVYEWVRGLSATAAPIFPGDGGILPFTMRDERRTPAQEPAIWSNVMFPNVQEIAANPTCVIQPPCKVNTLMRVDNAAFFPRENFAQLPIPGFDTGVDTLLIFQGNSADAAYDATVIQHEFGHGVVYATANLTFSDIASDNRSANNEGGALHEGFADFIAGAFNNQAGIGPYFGPRALAAAGVIPTGVAQDSFLRTLDNTYACPDVLWGEVHQDSQHVSASLWKARTTVFAGADQGHTFDAAFYAMLVSIAPNADFAQVAAVMAVKVGVAFPSIATASAQMTQIFTDKGVIGCSKIIDVTGATTARPYYGVAAASAPLDTSMIPGPYQIKISAPMGASAVKIVATEAAAGLGAQPPVVSALIKTDSPITFTRTLTAITNDAAKTMALASGSGTVPYDAPAGSTIYVSLGNVGGGATLQNVKVTVVPIVPDAGAVDAGVDAGVMDAGSLEAITDVTGPTAPGCGCSSFDAFSTVGLLAIFALRRRTSR
jgi:hypothetical protein